MHGGSLQPGTGHGCTGRDGSPLDAQERGTGARWPKGRLAYAGSLPDVLEEALGRDEELEQAAEPIPAEAALQQPEHLAQDGGGRGFEGWVEGLEGTLHGCVQRPGVLREESGTGGESGPAGGCRPRPAACAHRHLSQHRVSASSAYGRAGSATELRRLQTS